MVDRRGLGSGLSSLLGDPAPAEGGGGSAPVLVAIDRIARNPNQPRKMFDEAELAALTESVREKGVLQPILVRPNPPGLDGYEIVAGERRWRAAQAAGLREMPVLVREFDDLEVLEVAVIENVQRADLNAIEEAEGYRALIDRFGRTQEAVAKAVGKSRSHVANALRLLDLPEEVREHLIAGRLTAGHARAIAAAPYAHVLADRIVAGGLNVRQAEALAKSSGKPKAKSDAERSSGRAGGGDLKSADTVALEQDLEEMLGLSVSIEDRNGRGELRVQYTTLEQLDDICRRLSKPA